MKLLRVMLKDLRLVSRDRSALIMLLIVPIVVIVVVQQTQSDTKGIVFAVVDEDQGPVATALISVFKKHLDVRIVDRTTGERMVAVENSAPAALVLPGGMSKRYLTERPSTIELLIDPAQWAALEAIKVIFLLADRDAASLGDPFHEDLLQLKERSLTGTRLRLESLEQQVPGFSLMFVLLNLIFSVSFGLRDEEIWGTSRRLSMAPVSQGTILGGKLLARLVVGTVQLLILLWFGHFVYGMTLGRSPVAMFLVAVCTVFSMACFSVIIAGIARTREQIIPVGLSALFVLAALGGCWWPFYEQAKWLQIVGHGIMTSWAMFAFHDVMLRDRGVLEVAPKLLFLVGYGVASFAIGLRFFRYAEN